jgi:hypothetical protein
MRRLLAIALLVLAAALPVAAQAATPSAPAWSIEAIPYPSAFEAGSAYGSGGNGPAYLLQAYNVGGGATSGTFTVTDTLPKGLLPSSEFPATGLYGREEGGETPSFPLNCSTLGRKITCTGGTGASLGPGEAVSVIVPVEVGAGVAGAIENKAQAEGGGAAAVANVGQTTPISSDFSSFGFVPGSPYGLTTEADGSATTQAGAHPYQMTVAGLNLTTTRNTPGVESLLTAGGGLREARVELPKGIVIDPQAAPKCKESELERGQLGCPAASQIGTIALGLSVAGGFGHGLSLHPLYNMVPPPGSPAEFGFEVIEGSYVHLLGGVKSDGTFTLTAASRDVLARVAIGSVRTTLWGVPSDASHDAQRGECIFHPALAGCPVERTAKPFLTMPSACSGPLTTSVGVDDWDVPAGVVPGSYESTDPEGTPVGVEGCNELAFEPQISAKATSDQGDSPSGFDFDLRQPQAESAEELATANLKDATATLPEGLSVNPSAANGLDACTSAQIGLASMVGVSPVRFAEEPARCPNASKVGTAEVTTPLLKEGPESALVPHVLRGSVYLAKPFDNPFDSLLALYLVIEDAKTGIIAKLAGHVEPDQQTGQLATTFAENPELPLEDVKLSLFGGATGTLTTPITCGEHVTASTLVPWSTPQGAAAHPSGSFQTTSSCSSSEAAAPKTTSFSAGTVSPLSGSYSPFVLRLARPDGSQHFTGIETTLPEGLLGKLSGVSYCPESGIVQAKSREEPEKGKLEQQSPSCPSSSEVGTVNVTAGSGSNPIPVSGHAYLAGPYKSAPLSLVVIVPAVAGPFDLGTVVDRVALNVGEYDARIHAVADPLPTIRDGIPVDVRSIELKLDRPSFTLNPTSCEAMQIEGTVSTQTGQSAALTNRFQVGECGRLGFKPKISISLTGGTKRAALPALKAVVTYPKRGEYANVARAQVSLPHSEFLEQNNIGKSCTKPVLAAHACPAKSIYGKAKAWTPLLEKPLEGPVYLVGGYGYKLPAMVAELNGQIRVLLVSKIDTGKQGGIRSTFEAVPDAPVEKFVLELKGGKKYGLLINSENTCKKKQVAGASFKAQNGKVLSFSTKIANSCGKAKKKTNKGKGKKGGAKK